MITLHEELYRGRGLSQRLAACPIVVCGAGALGGNLAENLVRCGARALSVIDRDRVAEHNLSTQPYGRADIGNQKAKMLAHFLYRATGTTITSHCLQLTADNRQRLLGQADLVVDCFDNSESRALLTGCSSPCLHVGLSGGFAEVLWNEVYRVPQDLGEGPPSPRGGGGGGGGNESCDYPLARNIVSLAVATASEAIFLFLATGERRSYTITLADLKITPFL